MTPAALILARDEALRDIALAATAARHARPIGYTRAREAIEEAIRSLDMVEGQIRALAAGVDGAQK